VEEKKVGHIANMAQVAHSSATSAGRPKRKRPLGRPRRRRKESIKMI